VLSAGFALGVALLSAQAGFSKDLSAYLVGSILTASRTDILITAAVLVAVALVLAAVGKELVLGTFDRGALLAMGYPPRLLDVLLLLVIEATIIAALPAVGTILSIALIVAPAATARLWTDRLGPMVACAVTIGVASGAAGLTVSQLANVSAGAAIVLVACTAFAVSWLVAPRYGALAALRSRPTGCAGTRGASTAPSEVDEPRPSPR
jgi:manganese/iron transport system permease protein